MEIKDGVFIVTGSATGLGAAVAQRLANKGGRVMINYTRSEAEAQAAAEACRKLGGEAILCQADVSVDEDCRRMATTALEQWGRIDGLVNNAATSVIVPHYDLEGLSSEDFRRVLDVNVIGAFQMARAVTPAMQEQGRGAIVNVSSGSGFSGSGSSIAYAASKAALNVMTYSLARALAPEIRVNAVCPGVMQTRWWREGLGEENYQGSLTATPRRRRWDRPALRKPYLSRLALAVESAEHVTGETILVDAGSHLGPAPARPR